MTDRSAAREKRWVVLVSEDDALMRMIMSDTLRDRGLEVIEEESAERAISRISRRSDINLVVTDIQLAGELSGLDLAHWITENRPEIRILAVSGFPRDVVGSSRPERYTFMSKPFSPSTLAREAFALLGETNEARRSVRNF